MACIESGARRAQHPRTRQRKVLLLKQRKHTDTRPVAAGGWCGEVKIFSEEGEGMPGASAPASFRHRLEPALLNTYLNNAP